MTSALRTEPSIDRRGAPRLLPRRRSLPGGRAVAGGLLVAAAAVGTFAAYTNATADHRLAYVVAARDLAVGQRLTSADLASTPMDLSPSLSQRFAFRDPSQLVGTLVVGPLQAGELIQASDVVAGTPAPGDRELSFPVSSSRAVGGTLAPGDRVDVLATYGTGTTAVTVAVVRAAVVVSRSTASSSLTTGGSDEVVTLALPTSAQTLALAQAVNAGQIIVVRSTGAPTATDSGAYPAGTGGGLVLSPAASPPAASPTATAPAGPGSTLPANRGTGSGSAG